MFRLIDLEQLTQNQESQVIFTFGAGSERHGIQAAELFELLKTRAAQQAGGKSSQRKAANQKRPTTADSSESAELQGVAPASDSLSEEIALSN